MSIIEWLYYKRNQRRERLLRKWGKTYYFSKTKLSGTLEAEFTSLVPNDGQWHHIAISGEVWAKKDTEPASEVDTYLDGVKIANAGASVCTSDLLRPKEGSDERG